MTVKICEGVGGGGSITSLVPTPHTLFTKFQRGGTFALLTVNWRLSRPKSLNCSKNSFTTCAADQKTELKKKPLIFRLDGTVLVIVIRRYKKYNVQYFMVQVSCI